jgi:hypothetical protein
MTSLLQKINELDLRIDNISTSEGGGAGTTIDSTTDLSCNTVETVSNMTCGGTLTLQGNISSSKFRTFQPVNMYVFFMPGTTSTITQIASNITLGGGTLVFICNVGAYVGSRGPYTLTVRLWHSGNANVAEIPCLFYWNLTGVHMILLRTQTFQGIPARSDYNLEIRRSSVNIVSDINDAVTVNILEMPY